MVNTDSHQRRLIQGYLQIIRTKRKKMGWRKTLSILLLFCSLGTILFVYFCGSNFCSVHREFTTIIPQTVIPVAESFNAYKNGRLPYNEFEDDDLYRLFDVQLDQEDVIVFLHIQKTGGTTFGRHLVKNMDLESPCKCYRNKKRCDCYSKKKTIWLFSRYSTGWICGLHADWTELTTCVEEAMNKKERKVRSRK